MNDVDIPELYAWVLERLDGDYVRQTALAVAAALRADAPIGVAFQPGDGTRYDLLFVPVQNLQVAPGRIVNDGVWSAQTEFGITREPGTAFVAWHLHGAVGLDLRSGGFEPIYLLDYFETTRGSACALAILFNAVGEAWNG